MRPELQTIGVGDVVRLAAGEAPCFQVAAVDPLRLLVLVGADPKTQKAGPVPRSRQDMGFSWQWLLRPVEGGRHTRLVVRQRYSYPLNQALLWHLVEPVDFVMERRMLRGIKARAEGDHPRRQAA